MDRQTKLDVLQKELSRKDLTMGCDILCSNNVDLPYLSTIMKDDILQKGIGLSGSVETISIDGFDIVEILGHPVILSDVLVWLGNNDVYYHFDGVIRILSRPLNYIDRDLTKPYLSEQSDEVVDGLYEVYLLTKKD